MDIQELPRRIPRSGRLNTVDLGPPDDDTAQTVEDALARFGQRLYHEIVKRGWTQSEFARRVELVLQETHGKDTKFGRDSVSNYVRGVVLPTPVRVTAMAKALGMRREDMLPEALRKTAANRGVMPASSWRDIGNGNVWLQINQPVPFANALKIMELLKK